MPSTRAAALAGEDLCGYVLKKDSPSCGMTRVKVYGGDRRPTRTGVGLFAQALLARFPHLPVEEEGRLTDPRLRENFIERVFAYRRLRDLFESRWTRRRPGAFSHRAQAGAARALDRRPTRGSAGWSPTRKAADRARAARATTTAGSWTALRTIATPQRHTNVLQHMVGYFKQTLDAASRAELLAAIEDYRRGLVPLVVPITLMRHHVRRPRRASTSPARSISSRTRRS